MPWPVHPNGLLGASGDNDGYRVERSLRFNSGDSAYLNRTLTTPTLQSIFTLSLWVKLGLLGTTRQIFGVSTNHSFGFTTGDALNLTFAASSALTTTALFRDPSAWYHIVWTQNGTSHTLYVNGVSVGTATATSNTFNTAVAHQLGAANTASYFNGYLTEINFIDGQALTPSSFAETDAITGRWKARAFSGSYGTNGFYLKFADNSGTTAATLGKDSSGNGNNWTPNNFSVTAGVGNDSLVDSPTNYGTNIGTGGEVRGNYATANFLDQSGCTFTNGLLDVAMSGSGFAVSSIGISSGKWYAEVIVTSASQEMIGICQIDGTVASRQYIGTNGWYYYSFDGQKYNNGTGASYGATYTTNDIIGIALDMDSGSVTFYKNGTTQGVAYNSGISGKTIAFAVGRGSSAGSNAVTLNFGQRPFAYTAPTGFKAFCVTNFPIPTIQKPSRYMDVLAYTGTGASNSISSLGFSPDLVWIKNRGGATSHAIYDTTRLATKQLSSDTTGDEATSSTGLTAFGSNGFTLGTSTFVNTSGTQYVAWAWDEAPIAGMDIVDYTGNGANRTIAHTLGVAPKMLIVKARATAGADQGWPVWHTSIANTTYLQLNSTGGTATGADYWNSTSPTSSVFSVGTNVAVNASSDTYIAYVFAEVDGFSKFGTYTGNGAADGPFLYCGFRPKYILIKSSAYNWIAYDSSRDTYNVSNLKIALDTAQIENGSGVGGSTFNMLDILSNGFKLRSANVDTNSGTLIFAAFAESPFKYARAR